MVTRNNFENYIYIYIYIYIYGNATDPIWRVLASSQGISSWTPLKPHHSNPNLNPNPFANQLWSIDFLTPPTPLIILHRVPAFLNLLCHSKTHARFMQDAPKAVWSIPCVSVAFFFPSLKQNFIVYRSSKVSDCIFEIYQQWQPGFSRVYSNCCCSCLFEPEIIKIGQSSHKMYSNCCILTFDPSKHAIPKWCTGRKRHIPMAVMRRNRVGGLGWQYGTS